MKKKTYTCSYCHGKGHNKRGCLKRLFDRNPDFEEHIRVLAERCGNPDWRSPQDSGEVV